MTPLVEHTKPTYTQYPTSEGTTGTTFVNSTFDVPQPQNGGEGNPPEPAKKYTKEDFKQDLINAIKLAFKDYNQELLNLDLNNDENLNKLLNAFTDVKNLDELFKLEESEIKNKINEIIDKTKIAFNTGWSLGGFTNWNQNDKRGLSDRIIHDLKSFGEDAQDIADNLEKAGGFLNAGPELQKEALAIYFNNYFLKLDKQNSGDHDKVVKAQLQTFGKILINSTEKERMVFQEVVNNLLSENISTGLKETLSALSPEHRQAFAEYYKPEVVKAIYTRKDKAGNKISEEDLQDFVSTLTQYKDKDSITSDHEIYEQDLINFLNDNRDILETIKAKIEEGTALTEDEEAILKELNYKKSIASGEITGTAGNKYLEESEIKEVLTTLNTDNLAHGDDFYRDVIEMAHNYVQNHEEELNITTGDFDGLMDETSESKYSELLPPPPENGDGSPGSAYDYEYGGFVTISPEAVIYAQNNLSYLQEQIQNTSEEEEENPLPQLVSDSGAETPSPSKPTIINNYEELTKYLSESASAVYSIVTGSVKLANTSLKGVVLDTYQTFSSRYKGTLLCQASDQWFGDIKDATKNLCAIVSKTLASGDKGNCFNRTQALEKIIEDNKKRE